MYTRIDIIYKIGSNEREEDVSKIVKIYFSTLLFLYTSHHCGTCQSIFLFLCLFRGYSCCLGSSQTKKTEKVLLLL